MCRVLEAANVTPVLVFDGCRLPAKAATNQQRRERRQEAKEKARRLLQEGREQEAQAAFMQCVDVTPDMAHDVMLRLR
jgi:exonuclease-1